MAVHTSQTGKWRLKEQRSWHLAEPGLAFQSWQLSVAPFGLFLPASSFACLWSGLCNCEALSTHLPSQISAQGVTYYHPPRQIRLSGWHWSCELVLLQLEKDHGDPWQKTWFCGLFNKGKGPRAKGSPHPSSWHTAEACWAFLEWSWLNLQLELHTVFHLFSIRIST